jgi:polyisoprenoid-binding protein YceI
MTGGGSARRALAGSLLALVALHASTLAGDLYRIDEHVASVEFSVDGLGLFSERGSFGRFHGLLSLDLARPEATTIAVTTDAKSAMMGWAAATAQLRSPAYFDVARYPVMHFASRQVTRSAPDLYRVAGTVEIRGIERPLQLQARLVHPAHAPGPGPAAADFVVTGEIRRSALGMTADRPLISDFVHLTIHAHILLRSATDG